MKDDNSEDAKASYITVFFRSNMEFIEFCHRKSIGEADESEKNYAKRKKTKQEILIINKAKKKQREK